jgi:hypothetical protein
LRFDALDRAGELLGELALAPAGKALAAADEERRGEEPAGGDGMSGQHEELEGTRALRVKQLGERILSIMYDTLSPDGTIRVRWDEFEPRMSIWLQNPIVVRTRDDVVVAAFPSSWTGSVVEWPASGRVTFELLNYPRGDIRTRVTVDVELERCFAEGAERPAREVDALLDTLLARAIGPLVLRPDGACPFCANATAIVPQGVGRVRCVICERIYPARA